MGVWGDFGGRGKNIWWEPPKNATTTDLRVFRQFGPDLTRRAVVYCMDIAICYRRKFLQVWGSQLPYQKSREISGAGRHPFEPSTTTWKNRNHSPT